MTIVVTGATGNVGRPLVQALVAAGADVRAVSRQPNQAALPAGVDVVKSAAAAIPGASAVFLNSRALGDDLADVVDQARRHGVARLVALSAINADDDFSVQPSRFRGDRNKEVEQLAVESGLDWVSLRPSAFASNFGGMWSAQIRLGDVVNGPYAAAAIAPIVDSDISAVAARALLSDDLLGQKVPLTGPQSLTNKQMVGIIGAVLGRSLRYQEIPADLVAQRFAELGLGEQFGQAYVSLLAATVGLDAVVTEDVEKILGRPAQTFEQWVVDHRDLFTP
jgi:uncharacterized protein YbjT (DUF2867 family)